MARAIKDVEEQNSKNQKNLFTTFNDNDLLCKIFI